MNQFRKIAAIALLAAAPGISSAFTVYDDFGAFPDATWAGSGIPNDAVAASKQIIDGDTTIRIAMNATGRFSNPQLANNGAGVFYAGPGSNCGIASDPVGCPSGTQGALWNWNYFIDITSGSGKVLADYQIDIWYDFNPAGPTACCVPGTGRINVTNALLFSNPTSTLQQGSENLLFAYLAANAPPVITAPGGLFNPNALGNYQFAITVSSGGFPLDSVAMEVQVVPVPAAVWLFGSALGLMGVIRRRARA
ncbi:MAG: hypothetical protein JNK40_02850 [Chromatiales bacterium]|nr:hypothetical protein [Chromatiales bacterium]